MVNAWTERLLGNVLVREWMTEADAQPHVCVDDYLDPDGPLPGTGAASRRAKKP